ncbi:hypothetical protein I8H83_02230 [Candidatus Saccharibacteria bacterium]|nr:hypothetical protein [Candidatus Saccharibacteria bacterium]MBH2007399.1 hypothetical protein [Candidatus Saccharibacteria bacterium]
MEYNTTYETTTTSMSSGEAAALGGIFLVFGLIAIVALVVAIVAMWKLFTKAGEPGWKALVPVYNSWVFLRLGDQAGWWALVALIPFLNIVAIVFMAIAAYNISLKLGKEGWYVVLYVLVPIIWILILAFDKSTWKNQVAGTVPSPLGAAPVETPAYTPPTTTDTDSAPETETKPPTIL